MAKTLISIIIPVYKVEKYIRACLESVYSQSVNTNSFEVIVINDGTRDNSMDIVNEFHLEYSNLKIINQPNQGLSVTRNNGLAMADGDFVWFVDSDDMVVPHCLPYILENLKTRSDVDVFISRIVSVDEKNYSETIEPSLYPSETCTSGKNYLFDKNVHIGPVQRYIFKRSFLSKYNLQFKKNLFHEDAEFGVRMLYLASAVFIFKNQYTNTFFVPKVQL